MIKILNKEEFDKAISPQSILINLVFKGDQLYFGMKDPITQQVFIIDYIAEQIIEEQT